MGIIKDLTGQNFNRWTVLEYAGKDKYNNALWLCECNCKDKTRRIVNGNNLRRGISTSCGCWQRELAKENCIERNTETGAQYAKKHGLRYTRIYTIWSGMIDRCYRENNKHYKDYGGRGINVCDEWRNDVKAFYDWSMNNGYMDDLSIDRIDVNGNYEPNNCRWATIDEQANNKRHNRMYTYGNKTQTLKQWADEYNINYHTLISRIDEFDWDFEKALTTQTKQAKKRGA